MKKFLTPFAILAASFAADTATAMQPAPSVNGTQIDSTRIDSVSAAERERFSVVKNGDEFTFVLKRNAETGLMMAWHESHASHSSHSSHSSHYSSRW